MREISSYDFQFVVGGATASNAAADAEIGTAIGKAAHGLNSTESKIGGLLGPVGAIVGAVIHFKRAH